ncbi:iodothyronine deiodinase-domain-containing protein [Rhizophagus clarus]|uniref:Iodothyronine deiodinase-domain-containing protein n=1 Tax=Rhizophagus clarus TaxID=94130 RepID=A0A8H3LEC9_9GLOM|nr:iodothyronine deiodinase-domain-containing protein [Rhizophagus clarus]
MIQGHTIQGHTRIPIHKQCLLFGAEQLHDSNTLKSCNIQNNKQLRGSSTLKDCYVNDGVTLKLVLAESNSLIHVKTVTRKNIILSVCENLFSQVVENTPSGRTLYLVLRLHGGMFQETSGHIDFNALPLLMQYMQVPARHQHDSDKVHAGIPCNYSGKSEWKGAR